MIQETEPEQKTEGEFKFRRGFKTWSENISLDYRTQLSLEPHDPICAFNLSEFLKIDVIHPEEINGMLEFCSDLKSGSWSALYMKDNNGKDIIIHNGSHSQARQQSDIMHEIAHVICMHPLEQSDERDDLPLLRKYNPEHENEAFWLGACLQLPRACLVFALKKKMTIEQIAEYYKASKNMVQFRINITGIKKQFKNSFG